MDFISILTVSILVIGTSFPAPAVSQRPQQSSQECSTYPDSAPGKCISVHDCPRLSAILQQTRAGQTDGIDTLRKSVCDRINNKLLLCCGNEPLGQQEIDDLAPNELWLHILLQLHRPYEDRLTSYKGDNNYVYHLDNETPSHNEGGTKIIVPYMEEFTPGKRNFKNLFLHPKGLVPNMFNLDVKAAVHELHAVYKKNPGAKGILKVAVNAKDHVNEYLHMHTLMHAIIHDDSVTLRGFELPAFYDVFPEFFTKRGCNDPGSQCCEVDEYPRTLTEHEWKLSYWREEAGFNDFHGSWHLYNTWGKKIPLNHGELFFYFHNQLLARYNMERLSNGLKLVTPLDNWSSSYQIPQNYIPPVLTDTLTRCADMSSGVLANLSPSKKALEDGISNNTLMKIDRTLQNLYNLNGIKYVGCALERGECGDLNYILYGGTSPGHYGIHNSGHEIMSQIGCNGISENTSGVMGNTWTAVRDPIFFRWHKFIDKVFQSHKEKLPEYSISQLALDGVTLGRIAVNSIGNEGELFTFNTRANLTMWFSQNKSTCFLQPSSNHDPFIYNINVDNDGKETEVNVRIYLAPKSKNSALTYEEQRTSWALMDRFKYKLGPGSNTISRDSCSSTITVPPQKSHQELINIYKDAQSYRKLIKSTKCQCGLPEHLLIPRGTPEGMPFQLFVYITPRDNRQFQSQPSDCPDIECSDLCSKDYTGCLHSDSEPMGFPFDRPLTNLGGTGINTIEDLANKLPNAMLHDITIFYNKDETRFLEPNIRMCE